MSIYPTFKDFHLWVGLILMIPIVAIGGTGIVLNHEHALGLKPPKPVKMPKADMPSGDASTPDNSAGPFTSATSPWSEHSTSIASAISAANAEWGSEVPLDRIELKNEENLGLVVKVKASPKAKVAPEEFVWSVAANQMVERKGDNTKGYTWAKIAIDLHTGKLFSKEYGWLWSDSAAFALLLLSGTGIFLYVYPLWKKSQSKKKKPAAAKVAPRAIAAAARPELETVEAGS